MDKNAKDQFKWKFYRLTIEINIIVLLVAVSLLVFLIVHSPFTIPVVIALLALACVISRDLLKKYEETKAWLDIHAGREEEHNEENNI